ncbi:helix-turn-helix transcriptional regulator [Rhizobium laguerreae]|uniref:helix-turn-helix transcriptional regulator n=1 Tax=Rhizobium laguerreae TaxID=1076926 RepID=UPI001C900955|nr:helix-turn-helix transcriptional regulator [Rhizobium laguerreae]MBY3254528.1 helix-turn-helix transcriptional regulator [Rhizobium laguerreae]MBY3269364.1 helix-turn-helix transcriptional regulator [Rhizobium laguerreae]MBY3283845.1 helix-turn-helix transcriptional regulator [Rhizobium laguerreae]MBY3290187.1 helix-turn-helix transcriptional regulator [Rhizobium laguerreae]
MSKSTIQYIQCASGERLVVVPEAHYRRLVDALEDRLDVEAAREIMARIKDGTEEVIPAEFVNRLLGGENTVKVWREFREMTVDELAEKAGIGVSDLSAIETGECDGSFGSIKKIAGALKITVDDLA